jgi:putative transposase
MARRGVAFFQDGCYHVCNRGANREPNFRSDENYRFLLGRVKKSANEGQVSVIAYCLMPNHYHFVLRQESECSVGDFVQAVFSSYSKAFNKMYDRSGTLFEGPFRAIPVMKEKYLIHLCRYVHRNPLDAGLVANLEDWHYSNYLEWIGKRKDTLVDREFFARLLHRP